MVSFSDALIASNQLSQHDRDWETNDKFQTKQWLEKLEDEKFYNRVVELLEEEVVMKFDKRIGSSSDFYEDKEEDK